MKQDSMCLRIAYRKYWGDTKQISLFWSNLKNFLIEKQNVKTVNANSLISHIHWVQ